MIWCDDGERKSCMSRLKKAVKVVVILPDGKNLEQFQINVNKIYLEMVKLQLKKSNIETVRLKVVIDKLILNF